MTKRSTAARSAAAPRGAALSLVALLVLVLAAPAAAAVPPLPGPVQDAVDTVDHIASSDDPVADVIDAVDDAIGDATGTEDPIQDTVDEVTGTGEQVVDDVEETVDGAVDIAEDVVDKTGNAVDDAVDRVDDATGGTIGDLIGGGSGEGPGKRARAPRGSAFGPDGFARPGRRDGTPGRTADGGERAVAPGSSPAGSVPADGAASPNDPFVAAEPGLAERLRDAAIEASKKLALPLALTIVVLGYVVMQYWADRKDPKLVLAPLESDHDLLSFQ